uniref:Uncharacterized protein n=1 Tax=Arundo donax TaxID=35708 RepID=A0A0A8ZF22_ARUDO
MHTAAHGAFLHSTLLLCANKPENKGAALRLSSRVTQQAPFPNCSSYFSSFP